jgi:hypothetical protein
MNLTSISKTIHLSDFPTDALIEELYNRIYDSIHDEEPRHDTVLNEMQIWDKELILKGLKTTSEY